MLKQPSDQLLLLRPGKILGKWYLWLAQLLQHRDSFAGRIELVIHLKEYDLSLVSECVKLKNSVAHTQTVHVSSVMVPTSTV